MRGAAESGPVRRIGIVGVGAGRELSTIRTLAPDADLVGWDVAPPMIDACRRRIAEAGIRRCVVNVASIDSVQVSEPFDVVVGLNAAYSYLADRSDRLRGFANTGDILRPGGVMAAVVQQRNGRPDWAVWFAARSLAARIGLLPPGSAPTHMSRLGTFAVAVHHSTPSELRRELEASGFDGVEIASLRMWAAGDRTAASRRLPIRSPNPLIVLARRPVE